MTILPFDFTFNNTFCISLEKSHERWDKMIKQFNHFNMDVQRWNASTPENITDNFVNNLSGVQKACTQSHINIYRHIIENNIEYALILEDDACFDFSWKTKLNELTNELTQEQYNDLNMVLLNASEPIDELFKWKLQTEQYLCAGYIITKKGASWILNNYRNCFCMSDWMTTRLQLYDGNCYSYFPWLIIQEGISSTIQPNGNCDADSNKVINCLNNISYSIKINYYTGQCIQDEKNK
jgi:GR25 family glycosyltransferase involved in LPS biosynthesis